jgi:hypothetical protein
MKKIIVLTISMVLFPILSYSQGFYQTKYGSIDSIHLRAEVYFDSIRTNFGDSALSAEGSEYTRRAEC